METKQTTETGLLHLDLTVKEAEATRKALGGYASGHPAHFGNRMLDPKHKDEAADYVAALSAAAKVDNALPNHIRNV